MIIVQSKKIMFLLLMSIVACFTFLFICFGQNAYADDISKDRMGYVMTADHDFADFDNAKELIDTCNKTYADKNIIYVYLEKDIDFCGHEFLINKGRRIIFLLSEYKIFDTSKNEDISIFKVKGELFLSGKETHHGSIQQRAASSNATIKVCDDGQIYVNDVDFVCADSDGHSETYGNYTITFSLWNKPSSFKNCNFSGKTLQYGVIYVWLSRVNNSLITFQDCNFNDCKCKEDGGAIYCVGDDVDIRFNNCNFNNCCSETNGGAIYCKGTNQNYTFKDSTIENCKAKKKGGAIYSESEKTKTIFEDSSITGCVSGNEGGAIATMKDNVDYIFKNSDISLCKAGNDGGGIFVKSCYVNIIGSMSSMCQSNLSYKGEITNACNISCCTSGTCGGAIYTSFAPGCGNHVVINGFNFISNECKDYGGAVCTCGTYNRIEHCCFDHNNSLTDCGSVCAWANDFWDASWEPDIINNEFYENTSNRNSHTAGFSYWKLQHVHDNRFYYKDSFDVKTEFGKQVTGEQFPKCCKAIKSEYKIYGSCLLVHTVPFIVQVPLAYKNVEILDEHDNVIAITQTDAIGNYQVTLNRCSKIKVRVCCPISSEHVKVSDLIELNSDYQWNANFS